jgi:hypothetical protein
MGELINLNPRTPIADADIPGGIARDAEVAAAMNAHLEQPHPHLQYPTQAAADARYFRGRSQIHTLDPPTIGSGELYKIFFTFVGANLGDICLVSPISVNLFSTALWPFRFFGMVEGTDIVAVYLHNTHSVAIDVASFQIRVAVFNF